MSNKQITTPILIEIDQAIYKLIYLSFSEDGSIYVHFPRKQGYTISRDIDLPDKLYGEHEITLTEVSSDYNSPYLSFHPKTESIHVNTGNNGRYKFDGRVMNMALGGDVLLFPLSQIIFPNFKELDIFKPKKEYIMPYILKSPITDPDVSLSLELWIHPVGTYFDIKDLPFMEERRRSTNIIDGVTFNNPNLKKFTYSLVVSELKHTVEKFVRPGVIVSVFNKNVPFIFELAPKE